MAYGKIKADTLIYDNSGSDVEVTLSSLGNKADSASPTFTGTPAAPTAAANTNTTQIATTAYVQTELGDYATLAAPALTGTATGVNLTLSGDLTVNGTTTTINSTTLAVDDKNIELGTVDTPTDTTADGGGITLKGATDKTITWSNSTDTWDFNQGITASKTVDLTGSGSGDGFSITNNGDHYCSLDFDADRTSANNALAIISGKWNNSAVCNIRLESGEDTTNKDDGRIVFETRTSGSSATTALTLHSTQNATFAGRVEDSKGDLRSIPQVGSLSANYTLATGDTGKHILTNTKDIIVPNSTFSAGDAITLVNNGSTATTITKNITNLYNPADGSTPTQLAAKGMCTILFVSGTEAYISGAGLS